jgi:hypothetical protein
MTMRIYATATAALGWFALALQWLRSCKWLKTTTLG